MFICVFKFICLYICVHVSVKTRGQSWVLPLRNYPPWVFRKRFSLELDVLTD